MSPAAHPALVLNADFRPLSYFPLSIWPWQDAVHAVIAERVSVVAEYDAVARSPSTEIRLPSVVALREYLRTPRHVAFTRFNVFLRDRFRCQYCGGKFAASELTFDHVVPRSRGGVTCWENIVAVQPLQHEEGQIPRHEAAQMAGRAEPTGSARGEARVPAELPARKLARLSLLGRRDRAIAPRSSTG
jgi:5-methylcytosine-specific restriction endonuclease McrA